MKKTKKLIAMLLSLCLAVSALSVSALAASDGSYHIILYTAERSITLPDKSIAVRSYASTGSFTFPSPDETVPGFVTGRPGFTFAGWKAEGDAVLYQPGDVIEVTQNLRFYGQWTAAYPFTDLDENADYFYDVMYVYEQGLMTGTSATKFSPNGTLTRAMMWTVLGRMDGAEISGSGWVEQAQAWAVENGISDGTFPDRAVSRQELATMLYRQAGSPDTYTDTLTNLNYYPNAGQVADWARDAIWWAINTNVLPCEAAVIDPEGAATRSAVASAVARFCALTAENSAEAE